MSDTSRFPSKAAILEFFKAAGRPLGKREVCQTFKIKGQQRPALTRFLRKLAEEGALEKRGKTYVLPEKNQFHMGHVEEVSPGALFVRLKTEVIGRAPSTLLDETMRVVVPEHLRGLLRRIEPGDKVLFAEETDPQTKAVTYVFRRRIEKSPDQIPGVVQQGPYGLIVRPADRRMKVTIDIEQSGDEEIMPGMVVLCEIPAHQTGRPTGYISEVLGFEDDPALLRKLCVYEFQLPKHFPEKALNELEGAKVPPLGDREDLRDIPLVTIDGADAKDFDDAVFAKREGNLWHLIVAIADVSHYVPTGSHLDEEALSRGNSIYLPGSVIPMLPEALSNDLCSLRPNEDRAALAAHLWINDHGEKVKHTFSRALIRSHRRLTYEQVEDYLEGKTKDDFLDGIIPPLHQAFERLDNQRQKRGTLDFELTEPVIEFDSSGKPTGISPRKRLTSHKIIEEFMILANIAAAQTLDHCKIPALHRVHDLPSSEKIETLNSLLQTMAIPKVMTPVRSPKALKAVFKEIEGLDNAPAIQELILRSQTKALYKPDAKGHFGLGLEDYTHFTSPIRRYCDLLVHRQLITCLELPSEKPVKNTLSHAKAAEIGLHISNQERVAMDAERITLARIGALCLKNRVGESFPGLINGMTSTGLFIELVGIGLEGFLPLSSLGDDYYILDDTGYRVVGRRTGKSYNLGAKLVVFLNQVSPITGSLSLRLNAVESPTRQKVYKVKKSFAKKSGKKFKSFKRR